MKFERLIIENFLTIGSASVNLRDAGLVLVQGENLDDPSATSNGAGKSSIADALMWVLFGETARGEGGDSVVNLKAKKNCLVQVTLIDGDIHYVVVRHRKHATFKNALTIAQTHPLPVTDLSKGTERETEALITSILGCSKEVFMAAIYAGQEQTPDLPGMTDRQLKMLIEEAAGVSRLEAAYEVARAKALKSEKDLVSVQDQLKREQTSVDKLGEMIINSTAAWTKFENEREDSRDAHRALAVAHKGEAKKYLTYAKTLKDEGWEARLSEIDATIAGIDTSRATMLAVYKTRATPLEQAYRDANNEVARLIRELDRVRTHSQKLDQYLAVPCPECKRPHDPSQREGVARNLAIQEGELLAAMTVAKEVRDARYAEFEAEESKHAAELSAAPSSAALMKERTEVQVKIREMNLATQKGKDLITQAKHEETLANQVMGAPNPHDVLLKHQQDSLAVSKASVATLTKRVAEETTAYETHRAVAQVFGPAGVRAHILDTVTPMLNERTSEYLGILSDGNLSALWTTLSKTAKGELREKFSIDVTNATGAQTFKGLSGGEKRKVRLACMLALQDLVASRATKPMSLWIGDEIDDALDASGLERLMTILDSKARERGTVLIISHNDLKDWSDQVTTVTKKDGVSSIEGALC